MEKETKTTTEVSLNQSVEKAKQEAKESLKQEILGETTLTDEQKEVLDAIFEEAKMPVELKNDDIKLGERELDIRGLSTKNREQMLFRQMILNTVYQRQITQNLIDILRLMMIILEKLGVDDIIQATDDLLTKLQKQAKEKLN